MEKCPQCGRDVPAGTVVECSTGCGTLASAVCGCLKDGKCEICQDEDGDDEDDE